MWTVEQAGVTVSAFVKERANVAWSVAKRHVTSGKVFVDGKIVVEVDRRLAAGEQVELRMSARRPLDPEREGVLAYDDAHLVVIDKPAGVNSVPYEDRETGEVHTVALEGVFVQIGLVPNTDWLKGSLTLTKHGEIEIDARGQTSLPGVFAAGDVTTVPFKQIVVAMGEGSKAALGAFDYLIRHSA